MKIGISGSSGFIGKHLTAYLTEHGHSVVPLKRELWQENSFQHLVDILEECDALINLAGASINRHWTPQYKQEMFESRIRVTSALVKALKVARKKPGVLLSTSAVGYYPSEGVYDEQNEVEAQGFLASLCRSWEEEAKKCPPETRLVIMRLGVVLALDGGALQEMITPIRWTKVSAILGSGKQAFPWISIQDVCSGVDFLINHEERRGVYNLVSPQQITQKYLARVLSRAYGAWLTLPAPAFLFRLLFGERSDVLLKGQLVTPSRLLDAGFKFSVPTVGQLFRQPDVRTVKQLDLSRYMGQWYEVARFENLFERGMTQVTATYTLLPDGRIRVENAGYKKGVRKRAVGNGYCPDMTQPGKLKVSFFLWFYSDYYVLELDEADYQYALVGSSTDKFLWILSRTPKLKKETNDKLLALAQSRGYAVEKLLFAEE